MEICSVLRTSCLKDVTLCGRTAGKLNPGLSFALESAGARLLFNGQRFSDNVWVQTAATAFQSTVAEGLFLGRRHRLSWQCYWLQCSSSSIDILPQKITTLKAKFLDKLMSKWFPSVQNSDRFLCHSCLTLLSRCTSARFRKCRSSLHDSETLFGL